jgi:hypothetical protein
VPADQGAELFDAAEALAQLALVAGQDVEPVDGSDGTDGRWRIAQRIAPDRVISTVDPDARHAHKTMHRRQDGFKAHVAIEPDTGLITDCALTKASGPGSGDAALGPTLLGGEPEPVEVLGDSAYGSGEARAELAAAGHHAVIKPMPLRPAVADGFTLDDFSIDEDATTVTCPNQVTRPISRRRTVTFGAACRGCPLRARCTTRKDGRSLILHQHETLLRAARRQAETPEFNLTYRQHRPMVERSIAWLVRGNRNCATAAQPRTTTGCTTAPQRSTCDDSSPSAWTMTPPAGRSADAHTHRRHLPTHQSRQQTPHDAPGKLVVQPRLRLAARPP